MWQLKRLTLVIFALLTPFLSMNAKGSSNNYITVEDYINITDADQALFFIEFLNDLIEDLRTGQMVGFKSGSFNHIKAYESIEKKLTVKEITTYQPYSEDPFYAIDCVLVSQLDWRGVSSIGLVQKLSINDEYNLLIELKGIALKFYQKHYDNNETFLVYLPIESLETHYKAKQLYAFIQYIAPNSLKEDAPCILIGQKVHIRPVIAYPEHRKLIDFHQKIMDKGVIEQKLSVYKNGLFEKSIDETEQLFVFDKIVEYQPDFNNPFLFKDSIVSSYFSNDNLHYRLTYNCRFVQNRIKLDITGLAIVYPQSHEKYNKETETFLFYKAYEPFAYIKLNDLKSFLGTDDFELFKKLLFYSMYQESILDLKGF